MTQDEIIEMAREAGINYLEVFDEFATGNSEGVEIEQMEAFAKLVAAKVLAQPEQEPVATVESVATVVSESGNQEITMSWWHEPALPVGTKLYITPPQRKPLTDEQIMANDVLRYHFALNGGAGPISKQGRKVIDAIEAAHQIKE